MALKVFEAFKLFIFFFHNLNILHFENEAGHTFIKSFLHKISEEIFPSIFYNTYLGNPLCILFYIYYIYNNVFYIYIIIYLRINGMCVRLHYKNRK